MFDIKILGNEIYLYYDNRQYLLYTSDTPLTGDDIRWAEGLTAFIEELTEERIDQALLDLRTDPLDQITSVIE